LLSWFLNEQIEEEKIRKKFPRTGDGGTSKEGIFDAGQELATRIFVAGSPLDPAAYKLLHNTVLCKTGEITSWLFSP